MKDLRNALAKARDKWFDSEEGIGCCGSEILFSPNQKQYLHNRLERAFLAGWNACEKTATPPAQKEGK